MPVFTARGLGAREVLTCPRPGALGAPGSSLRSSVAVCFTLGLVVRLESAFVRGVRWELGFASSRVGSGLLRCVSERPSFLVRCLGPCAISEWLTDSGDSRHS